jgi:hypothetical protein
VPPYRELLKCHIQSHGMLFCYNMHILIIIVFLPSLHIMLQHYLKLTSNIIYKTVGIYTLRTYLAFRYSLKAVLDDLLKFCLVFVLTSLGLGYMYNFGFQG